MECADSLNKTDKLLWHKRPGHASSTTMKEILGCKLETGLGGAKPAWTPLEINEKLTAIELDKLTGKEDDDIVIGRLLYLTLTRPDIAFSVQTLSQFLQQPKKSHWDAAMRIIRYVKRQPGLGILMSS
uniref:GAG-pre-integrase domain-containing protein n=1 Tax=Solanum lycopersicum TaxID=4081 RepID=A0A3Q7GZU3_SOLLC